MPPAPPTRIFWQATYQPSPGGSLGWKTRGSLHGDFEKVAYELETSTTANPKCKCPYHFYSERGYHLSVQRNPITLEMSDPSIIACKVTDRRPWPQISSPHLVLENDCQ